MKKYFFVILSVLFAAIVFSNCTKESPSKQDPNAGDGFEYGTPNIFSVEDVDNSIIFDEETGITLSFPEGGTGEVSISKILKSPSTPIEGFGIRIVYEGGTPINIVLDTTHEETADVLEYGIISGIFDDEIGNGARWTFVPSENISGNLVGFSLMMPIELEDYLFRTTKILGSYNYWIAKIPKGSTILEQRVYATLEANDHYSNFITTLPSSLKSDVIARETRKDLRVEIAKSGAFYAGFWGRSFGKYGRSYDPTITLSSPVDPQTTAHETGHYLIHLLLGDDKQAALELQGSYFSGHGMGDLIGRENLLEDLAYFTEMYLSGSGGNYDLLHPFVFFKGKSPTLIDFPSLEGFTAHLLTQLVRTDPTIIDYNWGTTGPKRDIPIVGLSYGEVFEIISRGAIELKPLMDNIESYLGAEANKLPTICHRIGWRYSIEGKLVDPNGTPIKDAIIESIDIIGNKEYIGSDSTATSDESGYFTLKNVFPGKSVLRVVLDSGEGVDIPIEIDWNKLTTEKINLGNIEVNAKPVFVTIPFVQDFITKVQKPSAGSTGIDITSSLNVNGELYMDKRNEFDLDGSFLNSELTSIISLDIDVKSTELIEVNFKLDPKVNPPSWTWTTSGYYSKLTYEMDVKPDYEVVELPVDNGLPNMTVDAENGVFRITFDPKIHFNTNNNWRKWNITPWFNYEQVFYIINNEGNEVIESSFSSRTSMANIELVFYKRY